jgi:hypothetical protein
MGAEALVEKSQKLHNISKKGASRHLKDDHLRQSTSNPEIWVTFLFTYPQQSEAAIAACQRPFKTYTCYLGG